MILTLTTSSSSIYEYTFEIKSKETYQEKKYVIL